MNAFTSVTTAKAYVTTCYARPHVAIGSSLRCRRMSNDISIIEQYITCQGQFQNKDSMAKMNWVWNGIMS